MIIQIIKLKSAISEEELLQVARERESKFKALPGLIQKYYVHADYLTHDFSKFSVDPASLAFYYGFGARIKEEDDQDSDTRLGMRIPFGLAYYPQTVPFEIFGEVAPRLDITPHTDFGLDIMIGIRYRINPNK